MSLLHVLLAVLYSICIAPRPYNNDLRNAIVYQRLFLNASVSLVADRNGVSTRTVQRYVKRYVTHGSTLPDADLLGENRGRNATTTRYDLSLMVNIVLNEPTLYLDEIQDELVANGGNNLSVTTIHRWLRRIGFSRQRLYQVQ